MKWIKGPLECISPVVLLRTNFFRIGLHWIVYIF